MDAFCRNIGHSCCTNDRRKVVLVATIFLLAQSCSYHREDESVAVIRGEYVVGLDDADALQVARAANLELLRTHFSIATYRDLAQRTSEEVITVLDSVPGVAWAESESRVVGTVRPDDYSSELWGLENTGNHGGTRDADVGAFAAWDIAQGAGQIVAVIDTGIDMKHPDFVGALWTNTDEIPNNGIDDDENGYVDDVDGWDFVNDDPVPEDVGGHGTHVAGTVGARANDGVGVPGLAYASKIMVLKFLEGDRGGRSSDGAAAIRYAVDQGANVINLSWGSTAYSWAVRSSIAYADSRGVLVVAAAGNDGTENDTVPFYPASYRLANLISVAASDRKDRLADFSNRGSNTVHLAAPGVDIISTWVRGRWVYNSGTSMAAPHVAAAAAILLEALPRASVRELRSALLDSVAPLARGPDRDALITGGRLRVDDALTLLLMEPPAAPLPPDVPPSTDNVSPGDGIPNGTALITEIMQNPGGSDAGREWFEVYNPGAEPIDLIGWTIRDDDIDRHEIESHVMVPAAGYVVLAASPTVHGAVYSWNGGLALANGRDEIELVDNVGRVVDRVAWDDGGDFPDPSGASMNLDPSWLSPSENDDGHRWCESPASPTSAGDRGTPGAPNPAC